MSLQDTETRWDKNSSQADSAGSIPVTRSMFEYRYSRIRFENSFPLPNQCFGPRPGHFGPHLSTPQRSPSGFRGRSACSVMFSGCSVPRSSNVARGVSPQARGRCGRAQLQRREEAAPVIQGHAPALSAQMPGGPIGCRVGHRSRRQLPASALEPEALQAGRSRLSEAATSRCMAPVITWQLQYCAASAAVNPFPPERGRGPRTPPFASS